MYKNWLLGAFALMMATAGHSAVAQTVCTKDEQQGCLTFQIVGIKYSADLMREIRNKDGVEQMSRGQQAKTLGRRAYAGMKAGTYQPAGIQKYTMYVWMKKGWDGSFPANRMRSVSYPDFGKVRTHPIAWATAEANQSSPAIDSPNGEYAHLSTPHFALPAEVNSDKGLGVGWVIPNDIAQQIAYVLICPDGTTAYPDRINRRQGIVHDDAEIAYSLHPKGDLGPDEFVLSAAVWDGG